MGAIKIFYFSMLSFAKIANIEKFPKGKEREVSMKYLILVGMLALSGCLFGSNDPKPTPTGSPGPAKKCWLLPDVAAPEAAQHFTGGVWCESSNSHHSDCSRCGK